MLFPRGTVSADGPLMVGRLENLRKLAVWQPNPLQLGEDRELEALAKKSWWGNNTLKKHELGECSVWQSPQVLPGSLRRSAVWM